MLRAAAIHALSLHYPDIMGHTEDVQAYVITGATDIVGILPDLGLEGDELARAVSLLNSEGRDLVDDFPFVDAAHVDAECDVPVGLHWGVGVEAMPDTWPTDAPPAWYPTIARAYIVRALSGVYPELLSTLRSEQLAYVADGSPSLLDGLVAGGVSDADAARLQVLMNVEGGVFPFDLGLSGILNGTGSGSGEGAGGDEGDAPSIGSDKALSFTSADDVCLVPAFYAGHHNPSAPTYTLPYTIAFKMRIPNLALGTFDVLSRGPAGDSMFDMTVGTNGQVSMEVVSRESGNTKRGIAPNGTFPQNTIASCVIRSTGLSLNRREASLRINGVDVLDATISGNGLLGGLDRPIRLGSAGVEVWDFCTMKGEATNAQADAFATANTKALLEEAAKAVDPNALILRVESTDNLTVGVVNTGTGGNATCTGMDATNLVERPVVAAA